MSYLSDLVEAIKFSADYHALINLLKSGKGVGGTQFVIFAPNIALSIILVYIEVNSRGNLLHENLIFRLLQLQFHELLIFLAKRSAKEQNVRFWLVSHVMYPST